MIKKNIIFMGNNNQGQAALIVLIVSAVILTMSLAASRKTVTETRIASDDELLKQAFNTAESGVEYYLATGETKFTDPNTSYNANVDSKDITSSDIASDPTNKIMEYKEISLPKDTETFWLVPHNPVTGNIDMSSGYTGPAEVCVDNNFTGAVLIEYFYTSHPTWTGAYGVKRIGFNIGGSNLINNFTSIDPANNSCVTGKKLVTTIDATNNIPLLISVTPFVNATHVAIKSKLSLPVQGEEISSTSVVGDPATGVRSTVRLEKRYQIPIFLLNALAAEGTIDSN